MKLRIVIPQSHRGVIYIREFKGFNKLILSKEYQSRKQYYKIIKNNRLKHISLLNSLKLSIYLNKLLRNFGKSKKE